MQDVNSTETRFNESMVTIIVADMERSIDFYTKKLGLPLRTRYGNEFAIVDAPGVVIALHPSPKGDPAREGSLSIGLGVDSVESSMDRLAQRGIAFAGDIVTDPPMRFAFFKDPDGVEFYLAERSEWQ
ncbi:MAG TPA: VOC family protein [Candidatus Acidoferrum sp.]|jgi:catechol 2,3-dioxygenase-like lactoylglutathione lyase family enzyme|nr:VOC family protein [Candidatus Acidoferrum sp.]